MNRYLLCDCQIQVGNEFYHESLASCPLSDKVDRNMYLTINIATAYQLQKKFPDTILPEDFTSKLTDTEASFLSYFKTLQNQKVTRTA